MSETSSRPTYETWQQPRPRGWSEIRISEVAALFERWWPEPTVPGRWVVLVAAGVGFLAAVLLPGAAAPGVGLTVCGVAAAASVAVMAWRRGRAEGRGNAGGS